MPFGFIGVLLCRLVSHGLTDCADYFSDSNCSVSKYQTRSSTEIAIWVVVKHEMITTHKKRALDASQDINGHKDQLGSVLQKVRTTMNILHLAERMRESYLDELTLSV